MVEKQFYQEEEEIVSFEFMAVKPLGKASSGALITTAVAIALKSGLIKVYDIYGNVLMKMQVNGDINTIGTSMS